MSKETELQKAVVRYIGKQYPGNIVISDQNGLRVTQGQAKQLKQMRLPALGGHPDLWVMKGNKEYHGLFIELKAEGEKIYKVKPFPPEFRTPHLQKQSEVHDILREAGYFGGFAIGFDEAKNIIDEYFKIK